MLWINPHTSFYFRAELQMTSDEGLNAFGAATWGQPFLYQGFNEHLGWMHTTSSADCVDEFAETVTQKDGKYVYKYGNEERPVTVKNITINYKAADGSMAKKTFVTYATHHGPIVREADGKWIAMAIMNKPIEALEQSFGRTKAKNFAEYMKVAALGANSSNDTLYADDKGNMPCCFRNSCRTATTASITPSRWMGPIPPPTGRARRRWTIFRMWSIRPRAGCSTATTRPRIRPDRTPSICPNSRNTWTRRGKIRAAFTW